MDTCRSIDYRELVLSINHNDFISFFAIFMASQFTKESKLRPVCGVRIKMKKSSGFYIEDETKNFMIVL